MATLTRPDAPASSVTQPGLIRYLVLAGLLLVLLIARSASKPWASDFWEYSAIVRELATHPLDPKHPLLLLDAPHAFYTPYALAVGVFARLSGLDPVTALTIAGVVNLTLFLFALPRFVRCFSSEPLAPFYLLLFTLFLWGIDPWPFSGFFHLRALGYVIPYPSMFASAIAFFALAATASYVRGGQLRRLTLLVGLASLVCVTHAVTAAFMYLGMAALAIGHYRRSDLGRYLLLGAGVGATVAFALLWPYYRFFELVTTAADQYHLTGQPMYDDALARIFPALLGLPVIFTRLRSNPRDPLGLLFVGLTLLYAYGAVSQKWAYGRMIAFVVLTLHLGLADYVARLEVRWRDSRWNPRLALLYAGIALLLLAPAIGLRDFLAGSLPGRQDRSDRMAFLGEYIGQYDVVLSDLRTGFPVPTFGGKVVASPHWLAFVPDHEQRRQAVRDFFAADTSQQRRAEILRTYRVGWLLVNEAELDQRDLTTPQLRRLGRLAYADQRRRLLLIKINPVEQ